MRKIKKNTKYYSVASLLSLNVKIVYNHIQKLYAHIAKQRRRIKKLQLKITKMKFLSKLDAHIVKTQQEELKKENVEKNENHEKSTDEITAKKQEENVLDFINEIKSQAMHNTFEQAGFIYEPTSGLYWDSKTGYYYNPECDLYYNGNDGNWYKLNPITNEFTFHSATEAAKAAKKVQHQHNSIDFLIRDFDSLTIKNLQKNALGSEKEEEKAIKKILEESRQPLKCQEKLCEEKMSESNRRRHYSSSESDSDSSDYRRSSKRRKRSLDSRSRSRSKSRRRKKRNKRSRSQSITREDGELDTSVTSDSDYKKESTRKRRKKKSKKANDYEEIAKKYPPSLRLIVTESKINDIHVGKLFVVTFKGGSLGREGDHHHVLLSAENVSKEHLKFTYNTKKGIYQFIDKSRNGTMLNGQQVSLKNKTESEPQDLHHGDILDISSVVKLLAHVHEGLSTCDNCEPFNYTQKPQELPVKPIDDLMPSLSHKEQLKILQKRYGLQSEKYQETQPGTSNKNYEDRASQRRQKVGSSHDKEKTIQASVDQSISSDNKGFKLLAKMGWNTGESLGKNDSGIKEPVQMKTQQGTSGLGHENSTQIFESVNDKKKKEIWSKTQERYNKLKEDD